MFALLLNLSLENQRAREDRRSREVAEIQEAVVASPCATADTSPALSRNKPMCIHDKAQSSKEAEISPKPV